MPEVRHRSTSTSSAARNQKSRLRSGGALAIAKSRATRRPTSGQSWQPTNQTPMAWSGLATMTGYGRMPPRSLAHLKRDFCGQGSARQDQEQHGPATNRSRIRLWLEPTGSSPPVLPAEDGALPHRPSLQWTARRPDAKCWWCQYKTQPLEHLFKNCPQWKS